MDFAVFSDDNLDVKQWVGQVFESPEAATNPDGHAATVVMKLQLFIQEVNNSLDETSQKVLQSLPRVMREVESLKNEASRLKEQMAGAKAEIVQVEQETAQSMRTLTDLDTIKQRMEATRKALREADNWTTLSADVEEVFETGSLQQMTDKVAALQQSLTALAHVSDFEERQQTLEDHKNRLEAAASPHLVTAINNRDTAGSIQLVTVFDRIGRRHQLHKYYVRCVRASLQQRWTDHVEARPEQGLLEWMTTLSDCLVDAWHSQSRWLEQVMPHLNAVTTLSQVLADTLTALDPPLHNCLDTALKENADPLQLLEDCKHVTDRLVSTLLQAAENSSAGTTKSEEFSALIRAAYAPYIPQLKKYSRLQQEVLIPAIQALVPACDDLQERVDSVVGAVSKLSTLLHSALDRCLSLSHGYCLPQLTNATEAAYQTHTTHLRTVTRQLEAHPVTSSDWLLFHTSLRLLQSIGDLMCQTSRLEERLLSAAVGQPLTAAAGHSTAPPDHITSCLLLDADDIGRYEQLAAAARSGDVIELLEPCHRLLQAVNRDTQRVVLSCMLAPVDGQLQLVPRAGWDGRGPGGSLSADLPAFSYTPQEYITQVGQYLMTLPQHLEPFMTQHDPSLGRALQAAEMPYSGDASSAVGRAISSDSESAGAVQYIISCLAEGTCQRYADQIIRIENITAGMTRQLVADIDYLGNVLDDLGLRLSPVLHALLTLLRCPAAEYNQLSSAADPDRPLPPRIVSAVRHMRGLVAES